MLVTAVLPAEYGIDPIGTGRAFGLLDLYAAAAPPVTPLEGGPVFPQPTDYRLDSRQLTVPSLGSLEFKYELARGAALIYTWRASAPVDFDFHTEPAASPGVSETFERGEAVEKRGFYTAPYDGIHGWYWENFNDTDVTVTLEAAGFFSEARLFLPDAPAARIAIPARAPSHTADR